MKALKLTALGLVGAIALNAITPTLISAQGTPKTASPAAPATKKAKPSIWEQLNLTKEQKGKLQAIRTKRTLTISKVLNKDQKAIFDKLRGKKKVIDMFTELKLDVNQQKTVKAALQQANKDMLLVLNPEQRKQLSARKESAE